MSETKTYVLYHSGCADGFTAAWAAWTSLGDRAEYLPAQYGQPVPEMQPGSDVFLVDFSYKRPVLEELRARHHLVMVLDHHRTAQADLAGLDDCIFDMHKSGAMLAWEYFNPYTRAPWLVRYVQDRDLWSWQMPNSRAVSAALWSYPMDFDTWQYLYQRLEADESLVAEGEAILRYMQQQTRVICSRARLEFLGKGERFEVPVTNATTLMSEVGEELLRQYPDAPFAASYVDCTGGVRRWSLRSRGDFDVSKIARQYGGGGHKAAAGFETTL